MALKTYDISEINRDKFLKSFHEEGYVVIENVFSESFVNDIQPQLKTAIEEESKYHDTENHKDYGMLLACPIYGGKILEVPENRDYIEPFNWVLGDTCIMWVYTSSCMPPNKANHSSRIHVDRPYFNGDFIDSMGSLILLNDFSEENGATYLLPKSHLSPKDPNEDYFYQNAERLVAPKGSVFYFNLRLWHAGGQNKSTQWRNALGIGMIRPFLKQRIDLPRAMKDVDTSHISEYALQKMGFYAQPPTSIQEYYYNSKVNLEKQKSEWE